MELVKDLRHTTVEQRFMRRVSLGHPGGCWRWVGHVNPNGYGFFSWAGRGMGAHVAAYQMFVGPLGGLEPDHLCRVPDCVNPDHLEAVTHRENMRRGHSPVAANMAKAHCPKGHPYDATNTYRWRNRRVCRSCSRDSVRAMRARQAVA